MQPDDPEVDGNVLHFLDIGLAFSWVLSHLCILRITRKSKLARMEIYCPVRLPTLAPEEFIIDPVTLCGGMLEPWPIPLSPISASAVC